MSWAEAMWLKNQLTGGSSNITTNTVVTITQIPNNQYGYFIKLTDIDGETPLSDVVVNGVSDPNTELRTNANGELKFYSGQASHNVTWSNLPDHLTNDMFPQKLQGYINDLTSTIVELDVSSFYGYKVTIKDHAGNVMKNTPVYASAGGAVFKTTDANGQIGPFYSTATTQHLFVKNPTSSGYYYYDGNVTSSTKGQVADLEVQCSTALYTGNTTVGSTITFKGKSWIVAHKSGNNIYCSDTVIESKTQFGNNSTYAGSTLASVASTFKNSLSFNSVEEALVPNTNVNGVNAKIFVASYDQMNGGWSYFNSNDRRICNYNGSPDYYWTSSPDSGGVWLVNSSGYLYADVSPSNSGGFRPSVCLPAA